MKRRPEKNYKLPKYAAGLAAMLFAGGMTGCTDPTDSEVQLAGDEAIVEETTQPTTEKPFEETILDGDVEVVETCTIAETVAETAGEVEFDLGEPQTNPVPTQELALAGDLVME